MGRGTKSYNPVWFPDPIQSGIPSHCASMPERGIWKGEWEVRAGREGSSTTPCQATTWQGPRLCKPELLLEHPSDHATPQSSLRSCSKSLQAFKRRYSVCSFGGEIKTEGMFHCLSPFMIRYWSRVHWIHLKGCYWVHCFGSRLQIKYFKDFISSSTGCKALRREHEKRHKKGEGNTETETAVHHWNRMLLRDIVYNN